MVISVSSNIIFPCVGFTKPVTIENSVVFPDPLGPIRLTISPFSTSKDTSFTAISPPNAFVRHLTSNRAINAHPSFDFIL